MRRLAVLLALLATAAAPMSYRDFKARVVQPPAPRVIAYGPDPLQHVELWEPAGAGPFPVVVMLHGGCWQTAVAKADIMHALAADLVKRRIAVWNVEYRGVDVPGGGYPGTFQDVAAAADLLARDGAALGLSPRRIALGHSAGGHLAIWLAARARLPRTSPLWTAHPAAIVGAISLGGLPDLGRARVEATQACGTDTVDRLVGPATAAHPDPFADTDPARLLPIGVPQALFSGALDPVSPPNTAENWAALAGRAGDPVHAETVPGAGHFELITPGTAAWTDERAAAMLMLTL